MSNKTEQHKKAMILAMKECLGNISKACEIVGISRTTHYEWMKDDSSYSEQIDSIEQEAIDFVEGKLFERINGVSIGKKNEKGELVVYDSPPSDTAIIFYLKTKGKKRGYVERQEIDLGNREEQIFKIGSQEIKF
jgi:hypothetical protein